MNFKHIITLLSIIILLLLARHGVSAQSIKSTYFMKTSYTRNALNPALRPDQGYIGIPFMSNIEVDAKTNTFNLDNFTFPLNGERVTFMHSGISSDRFLSNISDKNYLSTNVGYSIFSMGFYKGEKYWNIDFNVKVNADVSIPKSFVEMIKDGFAQDKVVNYDLKDLSAAGDAYVEIGVSHSRPFLDKALTVGVKTKLLAGIGNVDFDVESLSLEAGPEYWKTKSKVTMKASGPGISPKYTESGSNNQYQKFDGVDFDGFSIPGYGLGFDIGAVYNTDSLIPILKGFKISGALTDIGFIFWSKGNSINLTSPETEILIKPNDYTIYRDGSSSLQDLLDDVVDDFEQAIDLKSNGNKSRTTSLRMNLNLALEYEILKNKLTTGFLFTKRFGKYFSTQEYTLSANYKPNTWFATSASYSFAHSKFDTFGLGIHLAPSKGINFFFASDYIIPHVSPQWYPTTSKALNFQLGISIPMGGKRPN